MVSQRDIAERTGVSVMTVSRVLRGEKYVRPEIVEKVRVAAKELDYRPNPLVQSLMVNRSRRVKDDTGLVIAWLGRGGPKTLREDKLLSKSHPFAGYYHGAKDELTKRGFALCDFYPEDHDPAAWERVERVLRARNIRGILLGPEQMRVSYPFKSMEDFSVVQIGRSRQHPMLDRVASDPFYAMQTCISKLSEAGYQRIGYLDAASHNDRSERRWEAAFQLKRKNQPEIPAYLPRGSTEFNEENLRKYIESRALDALISGREIVGHWLQSIPTPNLMGFACLNLPPASPFAGVETGFEYIGARAAGFLVDAIFSGRRGFSNPAQTLSIQGKWRGAVAQKSKRLA